MDVWIPRRGSTEVASSRRTYPYDCWIVKVDKVLATFNMVECKYVGSRNKNEKNQSELTQQK